MTHKELLLTFLEIGQKAYRAPRAPQKLGQNGLVFTYEPAHALGQANGQIGDVIAHHVATNRELSFTLLEGKGDALLVIAQSFADMFTETVNEARQLS